ncbi:unnamed protein product, partial [Durusdinium trenchii]
MDADVRKCAQEALDNGPDEDEQSESGCNWIGGILLAWTSPPVVRDVKASVQKNFRRPISPGDVLHSVSGHEVENMSRADILRALTRFDGGLGFRAKQAANISLADLLRKTGVLMFAEDCCCYKASSAAAHQLTLLQMEVEAPLADEKIQRLEKKLFGALDGVSSSEDDSGSSESESEASETSQASDASDASSQGDLGERFLDRLLAGVGDGFPAAIRQSAQEALASGAQEDEECKKGCNWIGGIRLSWTSPPTVREVKRHVQEHFPRPIKPGDALRKVDGKSVDGLNRREILGDLLYQVDGKTVSKLTRIEILKLLQKYKGSIGFQSCRDHGFRESAQNALASGPQPDGECAEGCNWIGGILLAWTSPPVVRDVKPEMQKHFPRPISPRDVLRAVDAKEVQDLSRTAILELFQEYKGDLTFRAGGDMDADVRKSAQEALQSGPQPDAECEEGCDWIGGILLAWTSPPLVRE